MCYYLVVCYWRPVSNSAPFYLSLLVRVCKPVSSKAYLVSGNGGGGGGGGGGVPEIAKRREVSEVFKEDTQTVVFESCYFKPHL